MLSTSLSPVPSFLHYFCLVPRHYIVWDFLLVNLFAHKVNRINAKAVYGQFSGLPPRSKIKRFSFLFLYVCGCGCEKLIRYNNYFVLELTQFLDKQVLSGNCSN